MSDREYKFELPINCPSFYLSTLIGKIVAADLWPSTTAKGKLPPALARRLSEASANGTGIEITKADLDSIPDDAWARALKVIG